MAVIMIRGVGFWHNFWVLSRVITRRTRVSFCICIPFCFAEQCKRTTVFSSLIVGSRIREVLPFYDVCVTMISRRRSCLFIDMLRNTRYYWSSYLSYTIATPIRVSCSFFSFFTIAHALLVPLQQRGHTTHTNHSVCVCLPRINSTQTAYLFDF